MGAATPQLAPATTTETRSVTSVTETLHDADLFAREMMARRRGSESEPTLTYKFGFAVSLVRQGHDVEMIEELIWEDDVRSQERGKTGFYVGNGGKVPRSNIASRLIPKAVAYVERGAYDRRSYDQKRAAWGNELAVLVALTEHETPREVCQALDRTSPSSQSSARRWLGRLLDKGCVTQPRRGRYALTTKGWNTIAVLRLKLDVRSPATRSTATQKPVVTHYRGTPATVAVGRSARGHDNGQLGPYPCRGCGERVLAMPSTALCRRCAEAVCNTYRREGTGR